MTLNPRKNAPAGATALARGLLYAAGHVNGDAEVRSENDYGPAAETEMRDKRADYFAAGTQLVWDVDPVAECVHVYRASRPDVPTTFRRGETADAEPAVPGWRISADDVFRTG